MKEGCTEGWIKDRSLDGLMDEWVNELVDDWAEAWINDGWMDE